MREGLLERIRRMLESASGRCRRTPRLPARAVARRLLQSCVLVLVHEMAYGQAVVERAPDARTPAVDVDPVVKRGIALRRAGKDREALELFRDALSQAPNSHRLRVHLATAHQALGQWQEAQLYLREALQHMDDPYIARHQEELQRALDDVADRLGTLEIRGTPPGANVYLSGRHLGALPLAPVSVLTGSYTLEVRMGGYYTAVRSLTVNARGRHRERIELLEVAPSPALDRATAPLREPRVGKPSQWAIGALAGAGGVAALTTTVALILRESYASRWNSDDCVAGQRTRVENCAADLEGGRTAGQIAIVSGAAAGVLMGSAAAVAWFGRNGDVRTKRAQFSCSLHAAGVLCSTRF